jgi:ribonuclease HI
LDQLDVWCDGACEPNPGHGGWAFVVLDGPEEINRGWGYDPQATNQRMEVRAAIEGIKGSPQGYLLRVHSDSKYTINCGSNLWRRKVNQDLWIELDEALKGRTVEWEWVKGHSGVWLNELVDKLANKACRERQSQAQAR